MEPGAFESQDMPMVVMAARSRRTLKQCLRKYAVPLVCGLAAAMVLVCWFTSGGQGPDTNQSDESEDTGDFPLTMADDVEGQDEVLGDPISPQFEAGTEEDQASAPPFDAGAGQDGESAGGGQDVDPGGLAAAQDEFGRTGQKLLAAAYWFIALLATGFIAVLARCGCAARKEIGDSGGIELLFPDNDAELGDCLERGPGGSSRLAPEKLRIHGVAGDGNCMFRALAAAERMAAGAEFKDCPTTAAALRQRVVAEARTRRSEFEEIVQATYSETYDDFLARLAQPGEPGDAFDLVMASHTMRRSVWVWQRGPSGSYHTVMKGHEDYRTEDGIVHVVFDRPADVKGGVGHYSAAQIDTSK